MALSSDGKSVITGGEDRRVICWDWRTGEKRWERGFDHRVMQVLADPGNRYVAVTLLVDFASRKGALAILDLAEGTPVHDLLSMAMPNAALWDAESVLVATSSGIVRLRPGSWEALYPSEEPLLLPTLIGGRVPAGGGEAEGILIGQGQRLVVLDRETFELKRECDVSLDANLLMAYANVENEWTVAATWHTVYRLFPKGESPILYRHPSQIKKVIALNRDRLAVASDYEIAVVQKDGRVDASWKMPEVATALEPLPDGRLLVADRTGFLRLYAPAPPHRSQSLLEIENEAECRNVFFAPSGRQLGYMPWHKKEAFLITATPPWDGTIQTLSTPGADPNIHHSSDVPGFYQPTGELVCLSENQLAFYGLDAGGVTVPSRRLPIPSAGHFFRFDCNGKRVLFTSESTGPLDTGPLLYSVDMNSGETSPVAFGLGTGDASTRTNAFDLSPDGKLAVVSRMSFARRERSEWAIFGVDTGDLRLAKEAFSEGAANVAFHPDGKRVALGYYSGAVEVWDIRSGKRLQRFQKDGRDISALRFVGNQGERLVTASADLRLRVWDWAYGEELLALKTTTGATSIALSADGMAIAHGGYQPALTVRFALPWWHEQGDPKFYEALTGLSPGR